MPFPTPRPLTVQLLSWTQHPIGTLFFVWEQSRSNDKIYPPAILDALAGAYCFGESPQSDELLKALHDEYDISREEALKFGEHIFKTVEMILDESVPVTENIDFVFYIENMSISLREQMVRHRIGSRIGERTGIDIIPDLAESSWWSQTTRVLPLDKIYDEGRFIVPDTIRDMEGDADPSLKNLTALDIYMATMNMCQQTYNKLVEMGVPREDARQIIPVGMTHGITWKINLKALIHIFGKRGCWIAQSGLWNDVMVGMIEEICAKLGNVFRKIILPPCMKKGKYVGCPVSLINMERVQGRDGMPPCPLFVYHQNGEALTAMAGVDEPAWKTDPECGVATHYIERWDGPTNEYNMLVANMNKYRELWGRDVHTGEEL